MVWLLLAFGQSDGSHFECVQFGWWRLGGEGRLSRCGGNTSPFPSATHNPAHRQLQCYIWPGLSVFKCLSLQNSSVLTLTFSCQPQGESVCNGNYESIKIFKMVLIDIIVTTRTAHRTSSLLYFSPRLFIIITMPMSRL